MPPWKGRRQSPGESADNQARKYCIPWRPTIAGVPELPEVETVTRSIAPLVGRRIVTAEFRCLRILRGGDPDHMSSRLQGRRIAGVKRYGKFILVSIEGGGYLVIHLGMTGRLLLGGPSGKHTHAIFTLDRGVLLYFDSRQFGCLQWSEEF